MTWTRFGYICRRALLDIEKGAPVGDSLARAEAETGSKLYGKQPRSNTLPRALLDSLANLPSRESTVEALHTYNQLSLPGQFDEPLRFKRAIIYLCCVVFVFYSVVSVYQLVVTPRFIELFSVFDVPTPSHVLMFQKYWRFLLGAMSVLLLIALLSVFQIRNLFHFKVRAEQSILAKLLLGPGVRRSYARVADLLRFPVAPSGNAGDDAAITQLNMAQSSGLNVSVEMRELIRVEMHELLHRCERQLRLMTTIVALVVISSVFLFLSSAYSPIFYTGDLI